MRCPCLLIRARWPPGEGTARANVVATEPERRHGHERGPHPRPERGPAPPRDEAGHGQERPALRAKQRGEEGERETGPVLLLEMAVERAQEQRREQRLGLADARLEQPARQEQQRYRGEHARPRPRGAAAEPIREEQRDRRAGPDDEEPRPGRDVSHQRERHRDQARKRLPARIAHRRERQRPDQLAFPTGASPTRRSSAPTLRGARRQPRVRTRPAACVKSWRLMLKRT